MEELAVKKLILSKSLESLDELKQRIYETKEKLGVLKRNDCFEVLKEEEILAGHSELSGQITGIKLHSFKEQIDCIPPPPLPSKSPEPPEFLTDLSRYEKGPISLSKSSEYQKTPELLFKSSERQRPEFPFNLLESQKTPEFLSNPSGYRKTFDSLTNSSECQLSSEPQPECAEKSLMLLHTVLSDGLMSWFKPGKNDVATSIVDPICFREHFKRLLQQVKTEELECEQLDIEFYQFDVILTRCMKQETVSEEEVVEMERLIFRALASIRILDVTALLDSVRQSSSAAEFIKGKDIIILLGSTGAGKSTMMHFLAGSRMIFTDVDGIRHLEPEVVMNGLGDVKLSCSSTSETTGIHAVKVQGKEKTYIICDTAGLADTRGPVLDIANGIVMTEAIRSARSVKVVLFITDGALSERFLNLRMHLIPSIIRLIPSFKHHIGSIFYLFNRVSDNIENIAFRFREFNRCLQPHERADLNFSSMIADLTKKTGCITHCKKADIVDGNPLELLKGIDGVDPIMNPRDVFHDFAAPTSITALKNQLNMLKEAITKGQSQFLKGGDKNGLELMRFKLRQLLELRLYLRLRECKEVYSETMQSIFQFNLDLHNSNYKRIERVFSDGFAKNAVEAELCDCMRYVSCIFDLEDMRYENVEILKKHGAEHHGRTNDVDRIEWLEESNMQGIIEALFLRMQNDCCDYVRKFFNYVIHDFDDSSMVKNDSGPSSATASLRLEKMCSLSRALNSGIYKTISD